MLVSVFCNGTGDEVGLVGRCGGNKNAGVLNARLHQRLPIRDVPVDDQAIQRLRVRNGPRIVVHDDKVVPFVGQGFRQGNADSSSTTDDHSHVIPSFTAPRRIFSPCRFHR